MAQPSSEPDEEVLYSASIVHDAGVYRLYLVDHSTGLLQVTELAPAAVAALPKYLPKLKLRVVPEAPRPA